MSICTISNFVLIIYSFLWFHSTEFRMKKHACTSVDIPANVSVSGKWVDMDVRQVFRHWLRAYRANPSVGTSRPNISDPYLLIDVRDQDYNVVKPSSVFQHCNQACEGKFFVFTLLRS